MISDAPESTIRLSGRQVLLTVLVLLALNWIGIWYLRSAQNKKNISLQLDIATLYQATGDYSSAVRTLDEVVAAGTRNADLQGRIGDLYRLSRAYDKAIIHLNNASARNPKNQTHLLNLARSYHSAGKYPDAILRFQQLIEADPVNSTYPLELASSYRANKEMDAALTQLDRVLELVPNYYQAYQIRADIYAEMQKWDESNTELQKAMELAPDDYVFLIRMGLNFVEKHEYNIARENFHAASMIKPYLPDPYYHSAEAFIGEGKLEEALPLYEKSLELNDNYVQAYIGLGKAYAAKDECNQAISYFEHVLTIEPNNLDVIQGLSNCSESSG